MASNQGDWSKTLLAVFKTYDGIKSAWYISSDEDRTAIFTRKIIARLIETVIIPLTEITVPQDNIFAMNHKANLKKDAFAFKEKFYKHLNKRLCETMSEEEAKNVVQGILGE